MTLTATMYGAQSIGASSQSTPDTTGFAIPITVTTTGLAVGLEVALTGGAGTWLAANLAADNGGTPGMIITPFLHGAQLVTPSGTVRWMVAPSMVWITAGDYWITAGSMLGLGPSIRYDTGSSGDGYTVVGTGAMMNEPGTSGTTSTATDRQYSLRLVVLTEALAPITGVLGATQDPQTAQLVGTVTAPQPPTPPSGSGGSRMGGTGAVRKPPR